MSELEVISGSDSGHCCFEASVRIIETEEHFCECFDPKDAEKIVNAVNNYDRLREALEKMHAIAEFREARNPDVIAAGELLAELDNLEKQQ